MTGGDRGRSPASALLLGASAQAVNLLPIFLTGALAVQMTADLDFGLAGLGVAVALYRGSGAVVSTHFGRLADALGATRSLRLAALGSAIAALGIATTATRFWILAAWLAFNGIAAALGQPAANRLLTNRVPLRRLGLAFGLKQAAPPIASMLAGLSVPIIGLTLGWRWAYGLAFVLGVIVAVLAIPPQEPVGTGTVEPRAPRVKLDNRPLIILIATAFGLGTFTSATVTTFYVDSAVRAGSTQQFAGVLLAVASIAAVAVRVFNGALADRLTEGHLRICGISMLAGAVGLLLMITGRPGLMAVGVSLGLAGTWGYNSILWYSLVRLYPRQPGRITGAVGPGGLIGSTVGPIVFGLTVQGAGYASAWGLLAIVAVAGAIAMFIAAHRSPRPGPTSDKG